MARYTGPRVRVSRRIGFNVFENRKGDKALQDRPYPPGVVCRCCAHSETLTVPCGVPTLLSSGGISRTVRACLLPVRCLLAEEGKDGLLRGGRRFASFSILRISARGLGLSRDATTSRVASSSGGVSSSFGSGTRAGDRYGSGSGSGSGSGWG